MWTASSTCTTFLAPPRIKPENLASFFHQSPCRVRIQRSGYPRSAELSAPTPTALPFAKRQPTVSTSASVARASSFRPAPGHQSLGVRVRALRHAGAPRISLGGCGVI
jgi:hypothetical protein